MTSVPKRWPGETVVLIGGGPSLAVDDMELVHEFHERGLVRAIGINNAYIIAPWVDVLYAADRRWIEDWHNGVPSFVRPKYSIESQDTTKHADWIVLRNTGFTGLELDPCGLRAGFNSGYQAVNLAVHFGAARILLLGYDMSIGSNGLSHWFGDHPDRCPSPYHQMLAAWPSIVEPLQKLGVEVINCSRRSALTVFPCKPLKDVLIERGGLVTACHPFALGMRE